jgi:Tol biopolymer transport system component/tRNA A-37 threonylcarbamoyl transferase component Bud32
MPLAAGTQIGSYEIVELLGSGAMGEVYRARDRKLVRDVAMKVLLDSGGASHDRVARFAREAQTLATLNHPNIAQVYDIEEHTTAGPCIVLELVPGRTLSDMLAAGPLPVTEALTIARQIADALEAAHEAGLVHRDLKPANVKIRDDGTVKVLDFGLAKYASLESGSASGSSSDIFNAPTMATRAAVTSPGIRPGSSGHAMTQEGVIMGTPAYMSPEQAKGRPVDRRTDIWAFGAILYEMLTGRGAFHAEDITEILAAVLTRQIDLADLPSNTPERLRRLIRQCLEREARQRLRDIGDARLIIDEILAGPTDVAPVTRALTPAWQRYMPWAVAAAALAAVAVMGFMSGRVPATAVARVVTRSATSLGALSGFVALSPDGTRLAYTSAGGPKGFYLTLRPLDRLDAQPIAGTDDGRFPVFSPDGRSIAFTLGPGGVRRVSIAGGDVIELCAGDFSNGAAWGADNTIVFSSKTGLVRVPATGGTPEPVTKLGENEVAHVKPQFLPTSGKPGDRILFTIRKGGTAAPRFAVVENGGHREIADSGDNGRFVASGLSGSVGHLVYGRDETLFAIPFDVDRLSTVGPEVPVIERVSSVGPFWTADYTVSDRGLLIYSRAGGTEDRVLSWIDRTGKTEPTQTSVPLINPRVSRDGVTAVGLLMDDTGRPDAAVLDLKRGTTTRLTFEGQVRTPLLTYDGHRVIFGATIGNVHGIYVTESDGSTKPRLAFPTETRATPVGVAPDGQTVLFSERARVYVRRIDAPASQAATPLHASPPGQEGAAQISPDGHWVAYTSDESGRFEIYMHEFPGPGRRERVSINGAQFVRWAADGRELIYWNSGSTGNFNVTSVSVQTTPSLQLGRPNVLFTMSDAQVSDFTADGKRGIAWLARGGSPTTLVTVTEWFEELRAKAPPTR